MHESDINRGRKEIECNYTLAMGATEKMQISMRWPGLKSQFFSGPQEFSSLIACFAHYLESCHFPSPPLPICWIRFRAVTAAATFWLCTTHTVMIVYRCMQTHAQTHTHPQRDTDTCMDECTHNIQLLLKDDCEDEFHLIKVAILGIYFPKKTWGVWPCTTRCTDAS